MGTISLSLPSDGQTIDSSDVNTPFNTIANEINGNLDNSNIKAGAAIDRSKIAGFTDGWENLGYAPNTITANGNRSYDVVFSSVDLTSATSVGQRLKLPRTVTAPTQCTSLNGTTQYYSRATGLMAGMTFTGSHTTSAWIKLSSYNGAQSFIVGRTDNSTGGYALLLTSSGQVRAFFGTASTFTDFISYQSIPLNKWVHVAASVNAAAKTAVILIDGVSVPLSSALTAATSVTQVGNFAIGALGTGVSFFPGKIAQAAVFSAQLSDATIKAMMNQTLTGSETSLVSAYTFNNSINDLSANANNLTAQGSAVATDTDTPFTNPVTGTSVTAGTTNYGIIMAQTFSTNTTYTIQIPEGETLPTTGGIGTVSYSTQKTPYGFPGQKGKWELCSLYKSLGTQAGVAGATYYNISSAQLNVPIGAWELGYGASYQIDGGSAVYQFLKVVLSSSTSAVSDNELESGAGVQSAVGVVAWFYNSKVKEFSSATVYYMLGYKHSGDSNTMYLLADRTTAKITANNAYL